MLDVNTKIDNMKTLEAYRAGLMIKPTLRNLFLELTMRCNERCLHCGSSCGDVSSEELTVSQYSKFLAEIKGDFGVDNKMLCITGGEPLLQKDICTLIEMLSDEGHSVEIETNGSISIETLSNMPCRPCFTLDYKLPSSGMESSMLTENYDYLQQKDAVKFVAGSLSDLEKLRADREVQSVHKSCFRQY